MPALNELLEPYGVAFGDMVLEGQLENLAGDRPWCRHPARHRAHPCCMMAPEFGRENWTLHPVMVQVFAVEEQRPEPATRCICALSA